jgi:Tannase-like family of unknown function (DUF6351)
MRGYSVQKMCCFSPEYHERSRNILEKALKELSAYKSWQAFDQGPRYPIDTRYAAMPALTKKEIRDHFPDGFVPPGKDIKQGLESGEIGFVKTSGTSDVSVTNIWNQKWWDESERLSWKLNSHSARQATGTHNEAILANPLNVGFISNDADLAVGKRRLVRFLYLNEKTDPALSTAERIAAVTVQSFLTMDTWLSSLVTSAPKAWLNAERTQAQVIAAKPAAAQDLCYLTGDDTFSTPITDMAICDTDARLVKHGSPHQVAGGPLTENILKCQLKPLVFSDYTGITFTAGQQARLQAVFPAGVCNWSKPGVGQQDPVSPQTYTAGPGGQPLGAAPASKGI